MGAGFCKFCADSGPSEEFDSPRSGASSSNCNELRDEVREVPLESKHRVFLSHSGAQKPFVEHLCEELERCLRFPFFDRRRESLPIGENFPERIFDAIQQCLVGVVILSEEFLTTKWPMMELVAMVDHAKRNSTFKIMPVYLGISIRRFKNQVNRNRWQSHWKELASENPTRIKVEKLNFAFNYLSSISSLEYDGKSEVQFQKEIVDAICRVVPAEIRLEDSYIQGRLRLCQVIQEKIDALQNSIKNGVCVVGLYGMGGMGKTSICKALCNEYFTRFCGRVCLTELEKGSEEELLREVLQSLSNTSREHLDRFTGYQLQDGLRNGKFIHEKIFLALDNLLDSNASIEQAERYLSAELPSGSIVMVTARSRDLLLRQNINVNNCIKMPELNIEEATSLFVKSCGIKEEDKVDESLIERCVMRCCFWKDYLCSSENDDYYGTARMIPMHYQDDQAYDVYYNRIREWDHHYHPLALDVLGRQFRGKTRDEWNRQLRSIDEDIFNQERQIKHPVFSILRKSFDTLSPEDQLLFMDVALFLPHPKAGVRNVFEWLCLVHNISSVDDVKSRLKSLKAKSLLERVDDGTKIRIGMHDLWRSFCVAETKAGELGRRRWAYVALTSTYSELLNTTPFGIWQNVQRMAYIGDMKTFILPSPECQLGQANFTYFPNVSVLKLTDLSMISVVLDLSGLIHLKSLEASRLAPGKLELEKLPSGLIFLSLEFGAYSVKSDFSQHLLEQIECLNGLKYLQIRYGPGKKLPNMSSMVSMQKAIFRSCWNVVTLSGLGPNLQVLNLRDCSTLQSCPGVGDLVILEELNCRGCVKLENLPDLQKLTNLRKLNISGCGNINEVPGLGDLVALVELHAGVYEKKNIDFRVPDMCKLRNLQVLHFGNRRLKAIPGFGSLSSLRKLVANFQSVLVGDWPSLPQLTKLAELKIDGWREAGLNELQRLTTLHRLEIGICSGVDDLPNLGNLVNLQVLKIVDSGFKYISGLSNLSTLESLHVEGCVQLEKIPDLQRLTRLKWLEIRDCPLLGDWDETKDNITLEFDLLDFQRRTDVRTLTLWRYKQLADVRSNGAYSRLNTLDFWNLGIRKLPDLCNFPELRNLILWTCESLKILTISEPMNSLSVLMVHGCRKLKRLPDLRYFPGLLELSLENSEITALSCSVPLPGLKQLRIQGPMTELPDIGICFPAVNRCDIWGECKSTLNCSKPLSELRVLSLEKFLHLTALPNLKMFPALTYLNIFKCRSLLRLRSSKPLPALRELDARGCSSLNPDDIAKLQELCPECSIQYSEIC